MQELELQDAVVKAITQVLGDKDEMLTALEENIAMVFALEDDGSIKNINAELEKQQKRTSKTSEC